MVVRYSLLIVALTVIQFVCGDVDRESLLTRQELTRLAGGYDSGSTGKLVSCELMDACSLTLQYPNSNWCNFYNSNECSDSVGVYQTLAYSKDCIGAACSVCNCETNSTTENCITVYYCKWTLGSCINGNEKSHVTGKECASFGFLPADPNSP